MMASQKGPYLIANVFPGSVELLHDLTFGEGVQQTSKELVGREKTFSVKLEVAKPLHGSPDANRGHWLHRSASHSLT
jgi:hypothetical protein